MLLGCVIMWCDQCVVLVQRNGDRRYPWIVELGDGGDSKPFFLRRRWYLHAYIALPPTSLVHVGVG